MVLEPWIENIVKEHGKSYVPAVLPKDIPRGQVGDCFDHCLLQVSTIAADYWYVEGLAKPHDSDRWILHAWITDGKHAFDPTWLAMENDSGKEIPMKAEYKGIAMHTIDVIRFVRATGYKSVLGNFYMDEDLAASCLHHPPNMRKFRDG